LSAILGIDIRRDSAVDAEAFAALWQAAWSAPWQGDLAAIRARSLFHLGAHAGERLVGYLNVAGDGGGHAFLLDTTVHPEFRRRGIATALVRQATEEARAGGAEWLHVDYEPHLGSFYEGCGFRPTPAGLIRLRD
jgi:ribosomal protein S18 acetylase RimI-like enzyme